MIDYKKILGKKNNMIKLLINKKNIIGIKFVR